jgi:hypothetical protein
MSPDHRHVRHPLLLAVTAIVSGWFALPISSAARPASAVAVPVVSQAVGLDALNVARLAAVDLDGDGQADLVLRPTSNEPTRPEVYLWHLAPDAPLGGRFLRVDQTGLPLLSPRDVITFADLDNDGHADAIVARYLDYLRPDYAAPAEPPRRTAWLPGRGDGRFGPPQEIQAALAGTAASIAVGDVNRDGLPDLWIGLWYQHYLAGNEAFPNDLLLQYSTPTGQPAFARWSVPEETAPLEAATDPGGRPTYGTVIAQLADGPLPHLLELNYGRRWNRLYALSRPQPLQPAANYPQRAAAPPEFAREEVLRTLHGENVAPAAGFAGDEIRHGRHPDWLAYRARVDPRFDRPDEPPFRANGNEFDAAVGDIDNDGDFDVFVSTIIHAWAGESSDRSRFLVNQLRETGQVRFTSPPWLSVDRISAVETEENRDYNQGDIFAELADLDNDGRLDLILCSSDYNDPPPHDERLRIFLQQADGSFRDATAEIGIEHIGAGQPALLDLDGDGALDLVVGQTFNRLNAERRRAAGRANGTLTADAAATDVAEPRLHVYHNRLAGERAGLVLRLRGDPTQGVSRDAFGAMVRLKVDLDGDPATPPVTLTRQLMGPGGHAGKRSDAIVHVGLGHATVASDVEIVWPGREPLTLAIGELAAGTYLIDLATGAVPQRLER